jgi:Lrp/AsnC family leucine-responsive transcriptional regulator
LRYPTGNYRPFQAWLDSTPELVKAHQATGEDCFVLKVVAGSLRHLEEVTGRKAGLGSVTTSVVNSSPLTGRAITPTSRLSLRPPLAGRASIPSSGGLTAD